MTNPLNDPRLDKEEKVVISAGQIHVERTQGDKGDSVQCENLSFEEVPNGGLRFKCAVVGLLGGIFSPQRAENCPISDETTPACQRLR